MVDGSEILKNVTAIVFIVISIIIIDVVEDSLKFVLKISGKTTHKFS